MDLYAYTKKGMVKSVSVDNNMIRALQRTVIKKQRAAEALSPEFYEAKFTLLYDSLRTLLEILALQNKLKIYNHEGYTAFLKEVINDSRLGDKFDALRRVRNGINYYGEELTIEAAAALLNQTQQCLDEMKKKVPSNLPTENKK